MSRWYDEAVDDLEKRHANDEISNEEYWAEMRDLNAALREEADEAAERARDERVRRQVVERRNQWK